MNNCFLTVKKWQTTLIIIFCLSLALFLRISRIDLSAFWLDEAGSANLTLFKIKDLLIPIIETGGNIFYIYLLKIWSLFFNDSEIALRALSLIISFISLLIIYELTTSWFSQKAGYWTIFLLSVNYFDIFYAVQARPYSLVILLSLLSYYYFKKVIDNKKIIHGFLYFIFTTIGLYTHPWFFLLLLSQIIYTLFSFKLSRVNLLLIQVLSFICFFPWLIILFTYGLSGLSSFIPKITLTTLWKTIDYFFFPIAWFYLLVFLFITFRLILNFRQEQTMLYLNFKKIYFKQLNKNYWLTLSYLITPLVLAFIISLWKPFYLPGRYEAIVLPAAIILLGAVLSKIKNWVAVLIILFLIFNSFIALITDIQVQYYYKINDKIAAEILIKELAPQDIIIYTDLSRPTFDYYLPRLNIENKKMVFFSFPKEMNKKKIYQDIEKMRRNQSLIKTEADTMVKFFKTKQTHNQIWLIINLANPASKIMYNALKENFKETKIINLTNQAAPMHYQLIAGFK